MASRTYRETNDVTLLLLAVRDITERQHAARAGSARQTVENRR